MHQGTAQGRGSENDSAKKDGSKNQRRERLVAVPNTVFDSDEGERTVYKQGAEFFYFTKAFQRTPVAADAVRTTEPNGNNAPAVEDKKVDGNRAASAPKAKKADSPKKAKKAATVH